MMLDLTRATPAEVRLACRRGELSGPTPALAAGHVQANLVVLPAALAGEFQLFCERNPGPCPILEVTAPGDPEPRRLAPGADLRTDLPGYRVWRNGALASERRDIRDLWTGDSVAFLLGCSFTFDSLLAEAGLPVRHLEEGCNVPMYRTNRECTPAGRFHGPLVVSMRPFAAEMVPLVTEITARYPAVHGAPVYAGDPAALGITDLQRPDYGDAVSVRPGEVPVFWACGATPQAVAVESRPPLMVTHAPGCMFVADMLNEALALLPGPARKAGP